MRKYIYLFTLMFFCYLGFSPKADHPPQDYTAQFDYDVECLKEYLSEQGFAFNEKVESSNDEMINPIIKDSDGKSCLLSYNPIMINHWDIFKSSDVGLLRPLRITTTYLVVRIRGTDVSFSSYSTIINNAYNLLTGAGCNYG